MLKLRITKHTVTDNKVSTDQNNNSSKHVVVV